MSRKHPDPELATGEAVAWQKVAVLTPDPPNRPGAPVGILYLTNERLLFQPDIHGNFKWDREPRSYPLASCVRVEPVNPTWRLNQAGAFRHRIRLALTGQPSVLFVLRPVDETVEYLNRMLDLAHQRSANDAAT
jgi:hypothetical protein